MAAVWMKRGRGQVARGAAALLVSLAAACGASRGSTPPTATASPAALPPPHADKIRFALVGTLTSANVWSLFDSSGYSYNNYAVQAGYWPRLFGLSIPGHQLQESAAMAAASPVRQEGSLYAATVSLKPDLTWTDGSPFSAEDVAFTVNTALAFRLGFDWKAYYNPALLDHAESVDAHTVKFYFKQMPDVGAWQYGALQGPIVQDKFWSAAVAGASALLPPADLVGQIETLKTKVAGLEKQVGVLNYSAVPSQGEGPARIQAGLKKQLGDLDKAINDLAKAQSAYDNALNAARTALYGLNDDGEPLLGPWQPFPDPSRNGTSVDNAPNARFPSEGPANFDLAEYRVYATRAAADAALRAGQVDVILDPTGASSSPAPTADAGNTEIMSSPSRSMRFLVFNTQSSAFSNQAVRQALACVLDQDQLAAALDGQGIGLTSFVAPQESTWYNPNATLPCGQLTAAARLTQAVQMLKGAGFSWTQEPTTEVQGTGLKSADGRDVPGIELLVPSSDLTRVAAGDFIQQQAARLGMPLTIRKLPEDAVDYAVFSSHEYDAAVLGWKVSLYPGYLCDWFGEGAPFQYLGSSVATSCAALRTTSDLGQAAQHVFEIQATLAADAPFVPLYSAMVRDPIARVNYPFSEVLGGLVEAYGAPGLAFPVSP